MNHFAVIDLSQLQIRVNRQPGDFPDRSAL